MSELHENEDAYSGVDVFSSPLGRAAIEHGRKTRPGWAGPSNTPDLRTAEQQAVIAHVDRVRASEDYRRDLDRAVSARVAAADAALVLDRLEHGAEVLRPVSMSAMRARPKSPYWLGGLVPMSSTTVLAGPPGVGKSFLCLDWALSVASGTQSHVPTAAGRVLYVLGEGSANFGARVTAWEEARDVVVPDGQIDYLDAGVNLSSPSSAEHLIALCQEGQYDLLIFDTWSQLSGVTDENSTPQTQAALETVRKARDTKPGASAVIVHHTDARGTKARGSTALPANTDTTVMIRPNKGGGGFGLTTELSRGGKSRDGGAVTISGLSLGVQGQSAVVLFDRDANLSEVERAILTALEDGQPHPNAELRSAASLSDSAADSKRLARALARLLESNLIAKPSHGKYQIV